MSAATLTLLNTTTKNTASFLRSKSHVSASRTTSSSSPSPRSIFALTNTVASRTSSPLLPSYFLIQSRTMASTRQPSAEEKAIIDDVLCLYQLKPSDKVYARYAQNAVFHDPVSIAQGLDSIKSQFNGMPKIFEKSETKKCDVLDEKSQPNSIVLDLTQHYVFKGSATPEKTVNSKISLKRNAEGLIEKHDEEWDHEPNKTGDDGFMGKLQELRKKADAKLVEMGVSSDPKKI